MESYEILWNNTLVELEKNLSHITYSTYVETLKAIDLDSGALILQAPSELYAKFLVERVSDIVLKALKTAAGITEFKIYVADSEEPFFASQKKDDDVSSPIDPKYTFSSFVVGSSNRYIYAAAKAVADEPGKNYNPLFIYGATGLGKTHIMHAIANEIKAHSPDCKIVYATCEKFTNDLIATIRHGKSFVDGQHFRNHYRNADVLIIDDIQFLSRKESTQEEFFHTFNELHANNKQIILSADCQPREIELLEDRLKTRFQSGLMAEVSPPDIETKIAILQKKAEEKKYILNLEVATFLAETGEDDVRSLEGLLNKVIFASLLKESPISIELAKEAISLTKNTADEEALTTDVIINAVCSFYKLDKADLLGKKRIKELVEPRQICTYLISELMNIPLVAIGKAMGGKDHTTIIYSRQKIADQAKNDRKLSTTIDDLKNLIRKK